MGAARGVVLAGATVATVLLGSWVSGGVATDDATLAMALTGMWFAVAVGAALLALRRWRRAALPAAAAVLVTVAAVGGWLLYTSQVDRVVAERVLIAPTTAPPSAATTTPRPTVTRLAAGPFTNGAHETRGEATLLRGPDGRLVLTLVDFDTAAGPDLRVRLVPAGARGVRGGTDIGALKGNKGDQQYDVPANAPRGRVVIWCRAFSVVFGSAELRR